MKTVKTIICIAFWSFILWLCIHKLSQGIHDENLISQMSQSTYDEIVDTLTIQNNGKEPSEHQIVTYYYERYNK